MYMNNKEYEEYRKKQLSAMRKLVLKTMRPFNTPLDCSQFLIDIMANYYVEETYIPNRKEIDYLMEHKKGFNMIPGAFYRLDFEKALKTFFPDGYVRAYRGFSFNPSSKFFNPHYDIENYIGNPEALVADIFNEDADKYEANCSLNVIKSAIEFTGCRYTKVDRQRHYHRQMKHYGVLFCYKAPIDCFISWGDCGESNLFNEFELYAKSQQLEDYLEKAFIVTKLDDCFAPISKKDLDYYSLDAFYVTRGSDTYFHKKSNFDILDQSFENYIIPATPSEGFKWYSLF